MSVSCRPSSCLLALLAAVAPAAASQDPTFQRHVLTLQLAGEPTAGCFGPDGAIYIVERQLHRVSVFDPEGRPLRSFGRLGESDGDLLFPSDIVCASDAILVLDTGHARVNVYGHDGTFQRAIGRHGHAAGELHEPMGLDADDATIAVADTGHHRVQIFSRTGSHVGTIAGPGREPGSLARPVDVAIAPGGAIIVTDTQQHRVQVFDSVGRMHSTFGLLGPHPGMLARPSGLAMDGARIYVADTENHRIQIFDREGTPEAAWGIHTLQPHEGRGRLHYPRSIALSRDGMQALACEPFESRCQLLARGPSPDAALSPLLVKAERITHYGQRADILGSLLALTDLDGAGVSLLDLRGDEPIEVHRIGQPGAGFGAFLEATGVSMTSGTVLVADAPGRRLTLFAHDHDPAQELRFVPELSRLVRSIDFGRLHALQPAFSGLVIEPVVARTVGAETWVLDAANERIQVLGGDAWQPSRSLGRSGSGPAEFRHPTELVVSGSEIVVVDSWNFRVQVLDLQGRLLRTIGTHGLGPGQFLEPFGACIAPDGALYVSDRGAHRVLKFDREGRFLLAFGSGFDAGAPAERMGAGALHQPAAVAWHPSGLLLVVDHGNHRGQLFTPDGRFVRAFGARFYVRPTLLEAVE